MTELEVFRDHCRAMASGHAHRSDCLSLVGRLPWAKKPPGDGCVPAPDRALFARLAAEIDEHLAAEDLDVPLIEPASRRPRRNR